MTLFNIDEPSYNSLYYWKVAQEYWDIKLKEGIRSFTGNSKTEDEAHEK